MHPSVDFLFSPGESRQGAFILFEWILHRSCWPNDRAFTLHDELYAVAGRKAEAVADLLGWPLLLIVLEFFIFTVVP